MFGTLRGRAGIIRDNWAYYATPLSGSIDLINGFNAFKGTGSYFGVDLCLGGRLDLDRQVAGDADAAARTERQQAGADGKPSRHACLPSGVLADFEHSIING
jgi:hypothetical protein